MLTRSCLLTLTMCRGLTHHYVPLEGLPSDSRIHLEYASD
jgi:hypothetical protein